MYSSGPGLSHWTLDLTWDLDLSLTIVSNNPALLALSKKHVPNQQLWFKMIFKFQVLLVSGSRGWIIPGGKVEPREVDDPNEVTQVKQVNCHKRPF